jgi:DnaJ-class molecular chaperone
MSNFLSTTEILIRQECNTCNGSGEIDPSGAFTHDSDCCPHCGGVGKTTEWVLIQDVISDIVKAAVIPTRETR